MNWQVSDARNGEKTLKLNNIQIYSKYNPFLEAARFIVSECNPESESYLLIGLGLGYHLKALMETENKKEIFVYYFSSDELEIFKKHNKNNWWEKDNVHLVHNVNHIILIENLQILIPNAWLQAIGQSHPLFTVLEVIKRTQISLKNNSELLKENFLINNKLNDESIQKKEQSKIACLVAAGPSLNVTINWLKDIDNKVDIYVVGAALKTLVTNNIRPTGVIISDPTELILQQFDHIKYDGILFYLSTANHKCVALHNGPRIRLFQKGFKLAEENAILTNTPLVETGGSVGTTTFSLLEQLGYKYIVLFGQDLGFYGDNTHANFSTSNKSVTSDLFLREEIANDGSVIRTNAMLQSFKFWYEKKMSATEVKVYNTALKGAKIKNVSLIDHEEFKHLIKLNNSNID